MPADNNVTVRITSTWDVPVIAEYGDSDEALIERARRVLNADPKRPPSGFLTHLMPKAGS